jgi:hypothetical protein
MCQDEVYIEFARLIGYQGCTYPQAAGSVSLRPEVRKLAWQLLGRPPESWEWFYKNPDGTRGPKYTEKMAELVRLNGKTEEKQVKKKK